MERLYSDEEVALAIHNLLILRNKGVKESDATGNGTGYSLTIKKRKEVMRTIIVTAVTMSTNQPLTGEGYLSTHSL